MMYQSEKTGEIEMTTCGKVEQVPDKSLPEEAQVLRPLNELKYYSMRTNVLLASRAEKILQAALNSKIGPQSQEKILQYQEQKLFEDRERARIASAQQVELKNRKRSPKNKVLFAEPLVTSQFEYEQTFLADVARPSECEVRIESDIQEKIAKLREMIALKKARRAKLKSSNEFFRKLSGDELTISSCENATNNMRKKRPHEMTEYAEVQSSSESGQDEGLFSSPKVAKIVPYYHDDLEELSQTIENGRDRIPDESLISQSSDEAPKFCAIEDLNPSHLSSDVIMNKPQSSQDASIELLNTEDVSDYDDDEGQDAQQYFDSVSSQSNPFSWIRSGLSSLSTYLPKFIF